MVRREGDHDLHDIGRFGADFEAIGCSPKF